MDTARLNIFQHREDHAWGRPQKDLPVTIFTGTLGAGKTTLLNHILTTKNNLRIAAAVNDFAAFNVDRVLIEKNQASSANGVVDLGNGCVCCAAVDGDIKTAVFNILQQSDAGDVDYLLVCVAWSGAGAGVVLAWCAGMSFLSTDPTGHPVYVAWFK